MKRRFACCWALTLALGIPTVASASPRSVASGSAAGTVTALSGSSFTIQTSGRRVGVVNALTSAAASVTKQDYPYVYGGGHAQAGIASVGLKGPGYNGHRKGYDCSGSVAAVLAGAALWPGGSGVPNDAGIIATLRQERLIVPGVGTGPVEVTLYDHPGVHIFMNIDGRFFGTSDGGGGGDPRGGAGWLDDGAPDASSRAYKAYHFVASVLRSSTNAGHIVSFQLATLATAPALELGDTVEVSYKESSAGSLFATTLRFPGATTAAGTVSSIAPDGSSFTLQTSAGQALTLTAPDQQLTQDLTIGDSVQVTYTSNGATLTLRDVTVTATAPGAPIAGGNGGVDAGGGGNDGGWSGGN
ncbi:MAG: hypothetical protein JO244_02035 [Solirubrobacterales bacterium]|nr:hypothetical protein [Solirubrobacterales bacterium]